MYVFYESLMKCLKMSWSKQINGDKDKEAETEQLIYSSEMNIASKRVPLKATEEMWLQPKDQITFAQ